MGVWCCVPHSPARVQRRCTSTARLRARGFLSPSPSTGRDGVGASLSPSTGRVGVGVLPPLGTRTSPSVVACTVGATRRVAPTENRCGTAAHRRGRTTGATPVIPWGYLCVSRALCGERRRLRRAWRWRRARRPPSQGISRRAWRCKGRGWGNPLKRTPSIRVACSQGHMGVQ